MNGKKSATIDHTDHQLNMALLAFCVQHSPKVSLIFAETQMHLINLYSLGLKLYIVI